MLMVSMNYRNFLKVIYYKFAFPITSPTMFWDTTCCVYPVASSFSLISAITVMVGSGNESAINTSAAYFLNILHLLIVYRIFVFKLVSIVIYSNTLPSYFVLDTINI